MKKKIIYLIYEKNDLKFLPEIPEKFIDEFRLIELESYTDDNNDKADLIFFVSSKHNVDYDVATPNMNVVQLFKSSVIPDFNSDFLHFIEISSINGVWFYSLLKKLAKNVIKDHDIDIFSYSINTKSSLEVIDKILYDIKNLLIAKYKKVDIDFFKLSLVFRELATNAVRHGNKNEYNKTFSALFYFYIHPQKVVITIEDEGSGFDYEGFMSKIDSKDQLRVHHRGMFLIDNFSEEIEVNGSKIEVKINI